MENLYTIKVFAGDKEQEFKHKTEKEVDEIKAYVDLWKVLTQDYYSYNYEVIKE